MKHSLNKLLAITITTGTMILISQPLMAQEVEPYDSITTKQLATIEVTITDAIVRAQAEQHGTVIKAKLKTLDDIPVYEIKFIDDDEKFSLLVDAMTGEVSYDEDE